MKVILFTLITVLSFACSENDSKVEKEIEKLSKDLQETTTEDKKGKTSNPHANKQEVCDPKSVPMDNMHSVLDDDDKPTNIVYWIHVENKMNATVSLSFWGDTPKCLEDKLSIDYYGIKKSTLFTQREGDYYQFFAMKDDVIYLVGEAKSQGLETAVHGIPFCSERIQRKCEYSMKKLNESTAHLQILLDDTLVVDEMIDLDPPRISPIIEGE